MDKNVGATDRQVRTALGAVFGITSLGILAVSTPLPELVSPVFGILALVMLGTAATGSCGLYSLIGADTCSMESETST